MSTGQTHWHYRSEGNPVRHAVRWCLPANRGHDADTSILKEITEIVVQLDTADSSTIKAFFKWVSASISVGSQKVESSKKEVIGLEDLPPPPPEVNVVL